MIPVVVSVLPSRGVMFPAEHGLEIGHTAWPTAHEPFSTLEQNQNRVQKTVIVSANEEPVGLTRGTLETS